jgi:hypothetical protein
MKPETLDFRAVSELASMRWVRAISSKLTVPFQSVSSLMSLRHSLAHGKTETTRDEWTESLTLRSIRPVRNESRPEWIGVCRDTAKIRCFLEDVEAIINEVYSKISPGDNPFAVAGTGPTTRLSCHSQPRMSTRSNEPTTPRQYCKALEVHPAALIENRD